jgi:hypothetical protein
MIPIYLDNCQSSPFDFPDYKHKFANNGIKIVAHPKYARIIMSSYLSTLKKYFHYKKAIFLLWTHEPYHDISLNKKIKINNTNNTTTTVNIMNVYTGDVFCHNFRYMYFKDCIANHLIIDPNDHLIKVSLSDSKENKEAKIVALSTYYEKPYYNKNTLTLLPLRYEIIEGLYSKGYIDVYGKGWDKHPAIKIKENSRNDRHATKADILRKYKFNLCMENTNVDYYITEKLWESIKYGCLPIYYSNSTIYQVFQRNSFVDIKDFKSVEDLIKYLENMTLIEYKERMNRCIDDFNKVILEGKNNTWRGKSKNTNINYLEYESCYEKLVTKIKLII